MWYHVSLMRLSPGAGRAFPAPPRFSETALLHPLQVRQALRGPVYCPLQLWGGQGQCIPTCAAFCAVEASPSVQCTCGGCCPPSPILLTLREACRSLLHLRLTQSRSSAMPSSRWSTSQGTSTDDLIAAFGHWGHIDQVRVMGNTAAASRTSSPASPSSPSSPAPASCLASGSGSSNQRKRAKKKEPRAQSSSSAKTVAFVTFSKAASAQEVLDVASQSSGSCGSGTRGPAASGRDMGCLATHRLQSPQSPLELPSSSSSSSSSSPHAPAEAATSAQEGCKPRAPLETRSVNQPTISPSSSPSSKHKQGKQRSGNGAERKDGGPGRGEATILVSINNKQVRLRVQRAKRSEVMVPFPGCERLHVACK